MFVHPRACTLAAAAALLAASAAWARETPDGVISPPLSPRNASYTIEARLDPSNRTIAGSEVIVWRNITSKPAGELQLHLYWNAWRNDRSTWLREAALAGARYSDRRPEDRGSIDVTSIAMPAADGHTSAVDITTSKRFIAPDDGNPDDETVIAVALPQPVAPGAAISVRVSWTAHVPRTYSRTGAIGNFFFLAQWFPKVGVFSDDGWNCHQFHFSTEFFSDYGTYDVSLTVPGGWTVGATGVQRERRDNADRTATHRYYQDDVHDFAWTTSPDYVEHTARFEHPMLPPVNMRLLLQPEHAGQAERHFAATRASLRSYGEWYGAYPYGHITIVDPAYQSDADGMEYPTLFTAGTRWIVVPRVNDPEGVTVHEAGHQFWYGIVGTNEFEDAWMDEGFNTFSEARTLATWFQPEYYSRHYFGGFIPWAFKDIPLTREVDNDRWRTYRAVAKQDDQSTPSYAYFPTSGGGVTYAKTALWLNTMERWLGWDLLQRIMSTYFDRWKFNHPKPHDFFDVVRDVAKRDLGWYFDEVYRSSNVFDYGIAELQSEADGSRFHTNVVVRRYGEAIFPVDVMTTFDDGSAVTEKWNGRERWKLYSYDRPHRAAAAIVDPNRVLLLDINRTNNSQTLAPSAGRAATKWSTKWMIWLEDHLLSWAFFV